MGARTVITAGEKRTTRTKKFNLTFTVETNSKNYSTVITIVVHAEDLENYSWGESVSAMSSQRIIDKLNEDFDNGVYGSVEDFLNALEWTEYLTVGNTLEIEENTDLD